MTQRPAVSARSLTIALAWLTFVRIAAVPVVMWLVLADARAWAAGVFLAAAVTDYVDGALARRWEVTSSLGAFLDTTADKLLVTGALVALVEVGHVWGWAAVVIIARELLIMGLRGVVASAGSVMAPSLSGKLKAAIQFVAIALAVLRPDAALGPFLVDEWGILIAVAVTVYSAAQYLLRFRPSLRVEES